MPVFAGGEQMQAAFVSGRACGREIHRADNRGGHLQQQDAVGRFARVQVAGGGPLRHSYTVKSEAFGAFRLDYSLKDAGGAEIARRSTVLVRAPGRGPLRFPEKFGVTFNFLAHPYPVVGNFISALGAGMMKSNLWGEGITSEADERNLLAFATAMRRMGVRTVGVLGASPIALTREMDLSAPLTGAPLFSQMDKERHDALWKFMSENLAPWSDMLEGVQLAPDGDSSFNGSVAKTVADFAALMPHPLASAPCVIPVQAHRRQAAEGREGASMSTCRLRCRTPTSTGNSPA